MKKDNYILMFSNDEGCEFALFEYGYQLLDFLLEIYAEYPETLKGMHFALAVERDGYFEEGEF